MPRRSLVCLLLVVFVLPRAVVEGADTQLQPRRVQRSSDVGPNPPDGPASKEAPACARPIRRGQAKPGSDGDDDSRPAPTHANVHYGPHERNVLDLWLAPSDAPTPLVVFIHGGGFVNGSKNGASRAMIRAFLDAGVSFMAINYRYRASAPVQDILRDCARSIQFARAHAGSYHLDPAHIAAYGGSAGAGISLWLAFHPDLADVRSPDPVLRESSRLCAAAAINTPATYNVRRWESFLGKPISTWDKARETATFYGFANESDFDTERGRAILADVDMLGLISRGDPPVFLFSAQPDGEATNRNHYTHHPNHTRAVKRRCDELGVPATVMFATAEPRADVNYHIALREFLLRHLQAPR